MSSSRRIGFSPHGLLVLVVALIELAAAAQPRAKQPQPTVPVFDATHLRQPEFLQQTWLVQAEDDPAWARPDFDDSRWQRFDPWSTIWKVYGSARPSVIGIASM